MKRKLYRSPKISPWSRFATGATLFPLLFIIDSLYMYLALFALLYALIGLLGERIRLMPFLITSFFLIFFHLLIPTGRLLMTLPLPWGEFIITETALVTGVRKSLLLVDLLLLSKVTITPDLIPPVKGARLLKETLSFYSRLLASRKRLDIHRPIASLDDIFISLWEEDTEVEPQQKDFAALTSMDILFFLVTTSAAWGFYLISN